jgi:predicted metal-dependent HD superfamily phosphohydrolase
MKSYIEFLTESNISYINLQEILNKWKIKDDIVNIDKHWSESQRSYHSIEHLKDLLAVIKKIPSKRKMFEALVITAIYHDIVYDPMAKDNEEKSAEYFLNKCENKEDVWIKKIYDAILDTKAHKSTNEISKIFNDLDMDVLKRDYPELLKWESGIYSEYKFFGNENYKEGRLKFLEGELDNYPENKDNLLKLIDYVKSNY